VIGALGAIEVISGSSDTRADATAPPLPSSVLVPPRAKLVELRGKPVAVNFWASWCAPCRKEAPALESLARSLDGRAHVVGVNWTDRLGAARSWIDEHRWTFPNLRDADGTVGGDYGLSGLPTTFIIDSHGRIADVLLGPQSESRLRTALESAR
jgi:cytochrome c biogenesis protein CcmG/thiol:disulfide interchange protein DsbE